MQYTIIAFRFCVVLWPTHATTSHVKSVITCILSCKAACLRLTIYVRLAVFYNPFLPSRSLDPHLLPHRNHMKKAKYMPSSYTAWHFDSPRCLVLDTPPISFLHNIRSTLHHRPSHQFLFLTTRCPQTQPPHPNRLSPILLPSPLQPGFSVPCASSPPNFSSSIFSSYNKSGIPAPEKKPYHVQVVPKLNVFSLTVRNQPYSIYSHTFHAATITTVQLYWLSNGFIEVHGAGS